MRIGKGRHLNIVLASLALALLFSLGAFAGEEPDSGSIELQLPEYGAGVELTAYQVATYDGGYFTYLDDFAGDGLEDMDLNDSEQVEQTIGTLETLMVKRRSSDGISGTADGTGKLTIPELPLGLYLLSQTGGEQELEVQSALVPIPYAASDGSGWIYDVNLSLKYSFPGGAAILNKVDDEGNVVGGVQFVLQEKVYPDTPVEGVETETDARGTYYWREFKANLVSDENGQIVITGLPVGTYRFIETAAPDGLLFTGEPYEFLITRAGETARIAGRYARSSGEVVELTVENRQTRVQVEKFDENGNPLAGATLVVKDAQGNVLSNEDGLPKFGIITDGTPRTLKRLAPGNYFLSEVYAPAGYQIAADVPFTVKGEENEVVRVTMTDHKIPEENKNSLTVTKHLVLMGYDDDLIAPDITFYVALFSDPERTHRVSDVKAVELHNSAVNSVTFDNLGAGTYYVGETDTGGSLLSSGRVGDVVFQPEYSGSAQFTFEGRDGKGEAEIRNVFRDIPDNFYLSGELTIIKQVLSGGEPTVSDDTFYARVFYDAVLTNPVGDVVALAMNGTGQTSVTVTNLSIGETLDSSATYYVAETDEVGNPLDPNSVTEFAISIDRSEIVMDSRNANQQVVITNDFATEETEVEESVEEGGKKRKKSSENEQPDTEVVSGTTTPKTGDDTDFLRYLILMALSAGVCAATLLCRRRRRRRE